MKQTLLITVLILFFVTSYAAQSDSQKSVSAPKAKKFGEIEMPYFCNTELDMRVEGFVKILRKTPSAKAYIIVYANPKIVESAELLVRNTKSKLEERKIDPNRIVFLEGGFREDTAAEFFIVSKGAIPPVPNPIVDEKTAH